MLVDAATYRVRARTTVKEHRVGGAMVTYAKSDQTWDSTLAVNLTNEVWFDTDDTHRAISRSVYDMATGNVVERWKPKQNAATSTKTTLAYDDRKLFVATETNEVGHVRDYFWEYGNGIKLRTDGPNVRTCTSNCPPVSPTKPIKEQLGIRVDGVGRTIEVFETGSAEGQNYTLYNRELFSYVDAVVVPTTPASVTHQVRESLQPSIP